MGIAEILTLVFIVLKLVGVIDWNWLLVLSPSIIVFVVFFVAGVIAESRKAAVFKNIIKNR